MLKCGSGLKKISYYLKSVTLYTMPVSFGEELQPYFRRQHELIILDDCLL